MLRCLLLLLFAGGPALASVPVAAPRPAITDESKVPPYSLPDPLVAADGTAVRTAAAWHAKRRPELLELFGREVYGRTPASQPGPLRFAVTALDRAALGGKATRKEVTVWFTGKSDGPRMHLLIYRPNGTTVPAPVFLGLNFFGNHSVHADPGITLASPFIFYDAARYRPAAPGTPVTSEQRGIHADKWQIDATLARGYATVTAWCHDLCPDRTSGLEENVPALFATGGVATRADDAWGAIGAWAWGLSRAMDYIAADEELDARRVAVHGFSRLGKAALWAAAQDERFGLVISIESGCGGAALSKRIYGETVGIINRNFPHWFARNFRRYADRESALPVDQHQLLALIAPRPLYVASAEGDAWSDPRGEFLSAQGAEPVYALLGRKGLGASALPAVDTPVGETIGYHNRAGKHDVTAYDWAQFLNFADRHLAVGPRELKLDSYGGVTSLKGKKTGWFHVEQLNGRWFFVTPEGNAFFSMGITHANETLRQDDLGRFNQVYGGDSNRLGEFMLKKIVEWGFNTAGYEPLPNMVTRIPYVAVNWINGAARYNAPAREYHDVFSDDFHERLKVSTARQVAPHVNNPYCIGYIFSDLPIWNLQMAKRLKIDTYVDFMRKLEGTRAGKKKYLEFLVGKYGARIDDFNRIYGFQAASADQIAICDFSRMKSGREIDRDDEAFLNVIADRYFGLAAAEVRRIDPHHLIMGDRLILAVDDERARESKGIHNSVLVAAARHVDVLSFQPFGSKVSPRSCLDHLGALTGRPALFVDTLTTPARPPASGDTAEYERLLGANTIWYYREVAMSPTSIGIHRCTMRDHQVTNLKVYRQGLLKNDDTEYPILVDYAKKANALCYEIAYLGKR